MPEFPKLTAKQAEKILFDNGFVVDRQKGNHRIYTKKSFRMVLPHHTGKILHPKIIKQLFETIDSSNS